MRHKEEIVTEEPYGGEQLLHEQWRSIGEILLGGRDDDEG